MDKEPHISTPSEVQSDEEHDGVDFNNAAAAKYALTKQIKREKQREDRKIAKDDNVGHEETDWRERQEQLAQQEVISHFGDLFQFLGESQKANPNILDEYDAVSGRKPQLEFFHQASFADKISLLCSDRFRFANYGNFMKSLQFQQDFINGEARVWQQKLRDGEYVDVLHTLDPANANPDDIALGLRRASLKSAMLGTPEYAAWKMATQIRASNKDEDSRSPKAEYPTIKGYKSDIHGDSIGDWSMIIDQYQKLGEKYAYNHPDLSEDELEHAAVRHIAHLYARSMEYQPANRSIESPYTSTFAESLAWAQLGEGVRAQLRGMRQKIQGVDLHNIERFIGKSGTSKKLKSYRRENFFLGLQIDVAQQGGDHATALLEQENSFELKKQGSWKERELARLEHKWRKKIDKSYGPERKARYQQEWDEEVGRVNQSFDEQTAYLSGRDIDSFIQDMEKRQEVISRRIEKRKSIAEKAIDLHFALSNDREEWDEDQEEYVWVGGPEYGQMIDWINDAPFGTIKRAHQRLHTGISANDVCRSAITEIMFRVTGETDENHAELDSMFADFDKVKHQMQHMMKLAGKLCGHGISLSIDELRQMSKKDTQWIEKSLEAFPFEDVKKFIGGDLNLSLVPKVSQITKEFGYDLDTDRLIDFTKSTVINAYSHKEVEGVLSSSLRQFTIDEVKSAMANDIDLKILNALKPYLSAKGAGDFSEISSIAKKITGRSGINQGDHLLSRYKTAVEQVGLGHANDLLDRWINLDIFTMIGREFSGQVNGDYQKMLELYNLANSAMRDSEAEREEPAIQSLKAAKYSEDQIIGLYKSHISAESFVDVFGSDGSGLEGKPMSFEVKKKVITYAANERPRNIKDALGHFDAAMLNQLIAKNANVVAAWNIERQFSRKKEYAELNTADNIIFFAANNLSVEVIAKTIQAGFHIDEIKKYPFLVSKLLQPNISS